MATKPGRSPVIQAANRSGKEAREAFLFDLNRRLADQGKILSADDLSGLYDPKRQLFTTIDGQPRPLTFNDLQVFRAAVQDLRKRHRGKAFRGGIKPKQVIDLSRLEDRERARQQIKTAIPVSNRGGVIHFQTNAGPDSDKTRHHVYVELLDYNAAVASPTPPDKIAKDIVNGNIRFDCDCGRHTFWYRFIATIGGYNYGRAEDGFPRVRNPKLYGVACKHVLRVMALLTQSPTMRGYVAKMIERGRAELDAKMKVVTVKEMQDLTEQMKREGSRQKQIKTTEEKREARANQPAEIRRRQAKAAGEARKAAEKARAKSLQKAADDAKRKSIDAMLAQTERTLKSIPGMTKEAIAAALKASRKELEKGLKK